MKQAYLRVGVVAAVLALTGAGCAGSTSYNNNPSPESAQTAPTAQNASIQAKDQAKPTEWLVIDKVTATTKGWAVVRPYSSGNAGDILGYTAFNAGENFNIGVKVDPGKLTEKMVAELYYDNGQASVFEVPGADEQVIKDGKPVEAVFNITGIKQATDSTSSGPGVQVIKEFQITATKWAYSPNIITVNKGDHVRLKITSNESTLGFTLPNYKINVQLLPKQTQTVEFNADEVGTYPFLCANYCGAGNTEMKGSIVVK